MTKLTKNFSFFEREEFNNSRWAKKIIEYIQNAERFSSPEESISNISKAMECIINEFIEKNELFELSPNHSMKEKIDMMQAQGRLNSRVLFNLMKMINSNRNNITHGHNEDIKNIKISNIDVCSELKKLFYLSINLFEDMKNLPTEFEERAYNANFQSLNISAISEDQRNDQKKYDEINENFKIEKSSIYEWLTIKDAKIVIPIYQRKYEWTPKNIDILFDDILKRTNDHEDHYFGTIAYKKIENSTNNPKYLIKIIDGQQRITTSLLILCATRDLIIQKTRQDINKIDWYWEMTKNLYCNEKIQNYIENPGGTIEDNENFRKILENTQGKMFENLLIKEKINFSKNYKYIYEKINQIFNDEKDIEYFLLTFLRKFKVGAITFDSKTFSNKREMEIFENLNSKGLKLSITDLIKNHLFNFCDDKLLNNYEDEIPKKWNQIISSSCLNSNNNNIDSFFDKIAEFQCGNELPNSDKDEMTKFKIIQNAINHFLTKKGIQQITSFDEYLKMMNIWENYMKLFNEALERDGKFVQFINCKKIIDIISDIKKRQLFAYFLFIVYEAIQDKYKNKFDFLSNDQEFKLTKNEKQSIQNLFLYIAKYIIKTKVITKQGESDVKRKVIIIANNFYNHDKNISIEELCKKIINFFKQETSDKYSFDKFELNLINNSSHNQIVDLLTLTEYIMLGTIFEGGEFISRDKKSIEHILPQDHKEWTKNMSEEEVILFNDKSLQYKNKIGNYLILSNVKNAKAKNRTFDFKNNNVYQNLSSPLYKNQNDDIDVSSKTEWTFEQIDKRTNALIKYITNFVITKND